MKIAYYPFFNQSNKYIEISQNCIRSCGYEIVDFKKINYLKLSEIDAVILNWYESVNKGGLLEVVSKIALRSLRLIFLKMNGVKIISTFHNRTPHDVKKRSRSYIIKHFMKFIEKKADKIIVLSKYSVQYLDLYLDKKSIEEKAFFIPHPNYIGAYSERSDIEPVLNQKFTLLFIGQVKHYKNIEVLIEMAHRFESFPIQFIIAGTPESELYKKELQQKTIDLTNVSLDLRFVDDKEIEDMIHNSDVIVLPYDLQSSMNSGTAILAFSNGRTVICPQIATLMDFDRDLFYSYTYNSYNEHVEKLYNCIKKAYEDWRSDKIKFNEKGKSLYEIVKKNNSKERITECYQKLFSKLFMKK